MREVCDQDGAVVRLGEELGRGGEGAVFALPGSPDLVAKLYHQPPDPAKQQKLARMVEGIDDRLRSYAAWPERTLHRREDGAVVGFTMQRITKRLPVHMLYSPAQRRELFPKARWDFLVFVARNLAAAFDTLHDHGHVLGDVNQGNALVGEDSRVILIDCDSFQVRVGGIVHRCTVGVAHFTPPELQRVRSFDDIDRTANHDRFGLAVLLFHLLMGGRHPYSGVPQQDDVGHALEADIRDFRYAYAGDAHKRLLLPPPRSVPIDVLPPSISALFERAFTEPGVQARPSARDWVTALDALRAQMTQCPSQPLHVYSRHRSACPWCELEHRRVVLFGVPSRIAGHPRAPEFDVGALRRKVEMLALPAPLAMSLPPMPSGMSPKLGWSYAPLAGTLAWFFFVPLIWQMGGGGGDAFLIGVLSGTLLSFVAAHVTTEFEREASLRRQQMIDAALRQYTVARKALEDEFAAINRVNGVQELHERRKLLLERIDAYVRERDIRRSASAQAEARDMRSFLEKQLIDRWNDPRVPMIDRIRLRGLGIETAADFDRGRLSKVWFNHPGSMEALVSWKAALVREYQQALTRRPAGTAKSPRGEPPDLLRLAGELEAEFATLQRAAAKANPGKSALPSRVGSLREALRRAQENLESRVR